MMPRRTLLRILTTLLLFGGASLLVSSVSDRGAQAAPAGEVAPFLYPPFPGSASEESIFDHTSPN